VNYVSSKDRNIAMVFQNYALYPHMTVFENIAFGLRLRKMAHHVIDERVNRASRVLEIESYLQKQPRQLSGGQRQRVALGRAIVREPDVFLMDEPLSNLDAKLRVQMREEISKLHRRLQTTTIYVTHDQIEAMTMGTRIVVMNKGVVQQVATPREIYYHPANQFVAGFIGSPPMNFVSGKILTKDGQTYFDTKRYALLIPEVRAKKLLDQGYEGKRITLGVRAESMQKVDRSSDAVHESQNQLTAKLEMHEMLGSDSYVYLRSDDHRLIVRVDPLEKFNDGEEVTLEMNMHRVHFFDPQTEVTVC
jgi:multiple sugar transport system ATP-binding protein